MATFTNGNRVYIDPNCHSAENVNREGVALTTDNLSIGAKRLEK